jgi:hypothetical protein
MILRSPPEALILRGCPPCVMEAVAYGRKKSCLLPTLLIQQILTIKIPGNASNPVPNPCFKFSNPSGRAMGDARMGDLRIARFRVGSGTFPVNRNPCSPYLSCRDILTIHSQISLSERAVMAFHQIQAQLTLNNHQLGLRELLTLTQCVPK